MSYIQDIDFDFQVGDQLEFSPAEGSYVISKLLAIGAEFYLDGNTIVVVAIPGQEAPAPAPVEAPEIPAAVEAPGLVDAPPVEEVVEAPAPAAEVQTPDEVVEASIPVSEDLSPAEDLAPVEEAVVEAPAPAAKRGRKPAAPKE